MTVWLYSLNSGEYEETAVVENGSVVSGDEGLVLGAFPDGIPNDEADVARMFNGPGVVASTDFEMEWSPDRPEWAKRAGNANLRKDEPLRETDDWHQFDVQPGMVEELTEDIADDVREVFDAVLDDDQVMDIIDRLSGEEDDDTTQKSLSALHRRLREIFEEADVVARIERALREETADAARTAIDNAIAETDEDPDVDVDAIESQLRDREVEFADKFAEEMSEDIRSTVGDGWAEGKGTREIASEIAEQADINEGWQGAEKIARQELHISTGHARSEFAADIGKIEVWNTSGDNRVRPAHQEMAGAWKWPGDSWEVDYSAAGRGVQKESVPGASRPGIGCRCGVLLRDRETVGESDYAGDGDPR